MFLALKIFLTPTNIKNGFKACGIWPLNYEAMNAREMGSSQVFSANVPLKIQVEEILEHGGLPISVGGATHYYVDVEASTLQE